MPKLSFPKEKISILLLEGIHDNAVADLADHGYTNVTRLPKALDEQDLIERMAGVHMLGIRSRSQLTEKVLREADKLMAVGCFCIGTNQVDLAVRAPARRFPYSTRRTATPAASPNW